MTQDYALVDCRGDKLAKEVLRDAPAPATSDNGGMADIEIGYRPDRVSTPRPNEAWITIKLMNPQRVTMPQFYPQGLFRQSEGQMRCCNTAPKNYDSGSRWNCPPRKS
jgi:hypothetical protein